MYFGQRIRLVYNEMCIFLKVLFYESAFQIVFWNLEVSQTVCRCFDLVSKQIFVRVYFNWLYINVVQVLLQRWQ